MTITTMTVFVDALEALTVTGVIKTYEGPPRSLQTANLPAFWVQIPHGEETAMTFGTHGGWPTLIADVVIAYEPVAQNLQDANFEATITQLDNLNAALRAAGATDLGKSFIEWTIRQDMIMVAENYYWAVIATITARG